MEFTLLDKTVNIIGKRNSGKSQLLRYLVEQEKHLFDKIYCISPTERIAPFYRDFVPENCVFDTYSEAWIQSLISKMTESKGHGKKRHVLLILDDLTTDTDFFHSKTFKQLYSRGRHLYISVIITQQYLNSLPPLCRGNCDFCVIGAVNQFSIDILGNEYLSGGLTKSEFNSLYHNNTKNYSFLVINNNSTKNNSPEEVYGSIKTPIEFIK